MILFSIFLLGGFVTSTFLLALGMVARAPIPPMESGK